MINSVRNTVLSVLNKNNYGYISPLDFNLFSKQAQMELYDEYFSSYNKVINMENARLSGTDYAEISKTISEVLEVFLTSNFLLPTAIDPSFPFKNEFYLPSLTTTNDQAYLINKVLCYTKKLAIGYNDDTAQDELIDTTADFIAAGVKQNDIVVNLWTNQYAYVVEVYNETELLLDKDIFPTFTGDDYIIYDYKVFRESEKVSGGKISTLINSSLTTPTLTFPAYSNMGESMKVYPDVLNTFGCIQAFYFRYPKDPKWTYITISGGEPVFDQSQPDYQDFELPLEDEYKLTVKILSYCGISIREADVVGFALGQEQHQQPTFSQKQ